ncbi:alpha/beta-hydrolase [Cadophora sp. DSE1049]|nr:alpha/beta-hydrolase [Cadophora sp. DSE1049]
MTTLAQKLLESPIQSLLFSYSFIVGIFLILGRRLLLPQFPVYQSLRTQIQKAYLAAAAVHYPQLVHRLPVSCSQNEAREIVGIAWKGYLIPGQENIERFVNVPRNTRRSIVLYAHGGGYARGEARMYIPYMQRWIKCASERGLEIVFLSVEYPLTPKYTHPTQRDAFLNAYRYLLAQGILPQNIIFMGDSAGGGICINSSLELNPQSLPQPNCSILISPWIDMSMRAYDGGNMAVESDFFVMANTAVPALANMFMGAKYSGTDPQVNPLYREAEEVRGLNPQLIFVGAAEFALLDAKEWATLCEKAVVAGWGELHVWALGSSFLDPKLRARSDEKMVEWMIESFERS